MADAKISELTELTTPALEDLLAVVDDPSGTPATKKATLANILALAVGGYPTEPQMRLTLESGVPVSTSDQTSKSTVYWTPYNGNRVSLYDGSSAWSQYAMSEIAIVLAGLTSAKGYDVFAFASNATPSATSTGGDTVDFASAPGWATGSCCWVATTGGGLTAGTTYWLNAADTDTFSFHTTLADALAGTSKVDLTDNVTAEITAVSLELSAAWASDTSRTDALTMQDGWYVKSGATDRLHLGGFYSTNTTTTEDSVAKRYLSNRFHQVPKPVRALETTNSWTYTTATWRQANGASTNQVNVFCIEASQFADISATSFSVSSGTSARGTAIGKDSTSAPYPSALAARTGAAGAQASITAIVRDPVGLGLHYYAWLEWSVASGTSTWFGDDVSSVAFQFGISGTVTC